MQQQPGRKRQQTTEAYIKVMRERRHTRNRTNNINLQKKENKHVHFYHNPIWKLGKAIYSSR